MMNHILPIFTLMITVSLLGCPTEPPPPPDDKPTNCAYPPGNRNFTWRLDTVAWWPSSVGGVWAFADDDAYVMGYIVDGTPPYTLRAGRHWNGSTWENNIHGSWGVEGDIKIDPRNDLIGDDHYMVAVGFWGDPGIKAGVAEFDNRIKKWKSSLFQTSGELRSVWTDGKGYFIAVGDNGMVYTKEGYEAEWVYAQAPTEFNFFRIYGISKDEIYLLGDIAAGGGIHFQQIWKHSTTNWTKLMDNQDTTGMPIQIPEAEDAVYGIASSRCSITDSLYLYIVGWQSFEFVTHGNSLAFRKQNLAHKGLPLASLPQSANHIMLFSPNDYWVSSLRYHLYHWNGSNFQKIEPIPSLPYGQLWGSVSRVQTTASGKTWMILEMSSQVYAVLQGVP